MPLRKMGKCTFAIIVKRVCSRRSTHSAISNLFLAAQASDESDHVIPLRPGAAPVIEESKRRVPQSGSRPSVKSAHDHRAGSHLVFHQSSEPRHKPRRVRTLGKMKREDAICTSCVRRGRHQGKPGRFVPDDSERVIGQRCGSNDRLPCVRFAKQREARPRHNFAQTPMHLLRGFGHAAISCGRSAA
jgi:hypothetical protein